MITTFRFEKIAVLPLDREQDDFYNDTTKRDKSKEPVSYTHLDAAGDLYQNLYRGFGKRPLSGWLGAVGVEKL